ncbi:hypothetical protein, no similarity [Maudiozyma saulgeensis]|uniref:Uncharacterized protein n=1 Tax=Maudiozyma saulgeensis TaxID=1789683 RepID=A0A1X7R7X9_9SACH|nr:hypothetical protein, no similarity [Kazachstania saulgeensis]
MPTIAPNTNIEQLVQLIDQFMEDLDAPLESLIKLFRISCNRIGYPIIKNILESTGVLRYHSSLTIPSNISHSTGIFQSTPQTVRRYKLLNRTGWDQYKQDDLRQTEPTLTTENKNSSERSHLSSLFSSSAPNGDTERTTIHEFIQDYMYPLHKPQMDKNQKYKVFQILFHSKDEELPIKKELSLSIRRHKFRRWKNK